MKREEKKLSLFDHPSFVQIGFYKYVLGCILILLSTFAACISMKSIMILLLGGISSVAITGITLHLYYILTRDKALILDAVCIDIKNFNIPLSKHSNAGKLLLKATDANNDRTYSLINKNSYNCNIGDNITIYTTKNALFVDANEYVVINNPLFVKVSKSRL